MRAVNLIPAEQRGGAGGGTGQSDGGAFIVLGLLGGLAVLALLYGIAHHQISKRRGEANNLNAQAQVESARANQLAAYTSFAAMRQQRQQAVAQLVDTRFDWAHAFHEMGRVLPYDASLVSVHGSVGAAATSLPTPAAPAAAASTATAASATTTSPSAATASPVTSATPPGSTPSFTITGCATSQSEVAQTLERLRLIDGVSDVQLQSSTKATGSSSGSGSSATSGGCPGHDPSFTVLVSFAALPTPSTTPEGASGAQSAGGPSGSASSTSKALTTSAGGSQ
jgi:hypothetical protein